MRIQQLALFTAPLLLFACKAPYSNCPATVLTDAQPAMELVIEAAPAPMEDAPTEAEEAPVEVVQEAAAPQNGYDQENPILVGAEVVDGGPAREREYLNKLTGPEGQKVSYSRLGSCCMFDTPKSAFGGLLDIYEVMHSGLEEPVTLYLNMYDPGEIHAPEGFLISE